jgi:hypothetical protein
MRNAVERSLGGVAYIHYKDISVLARGAETDALGHEAVLEFTDVRRRALSRDVIPTAGGTHKTTNESNRST